MSQLKIKKSALHEYRKMKQRLREGGAFVTLVVYPSGVAAAACATRERAIEWRESMAGGGKMELIDLEVLR